jgi:hypothetical protein
MAPTIAIAVLPPVVKVMSSGPSWLTTIVTVLIGASAALAAQLVIQLYVVPRVETRKRREDRWERNVLELGQLLTANLTSSANELHAAQLVYREVRDRQGDEHNPALVARQARDAEQAMFAYGSLVNTQMDWLIGRVISLGPKAQELERLKNLARDYRERVIFVRPLPEHDNRTDPEFDETWEKEGAARKALIEQVKLLADLRHPPRVSWTRQDIRPAGYRTDLLGGPDPPRVGR